MKPHQEFDLVYPAFHNPFDIPSQYVIHVVWDGKGIYFYHWAADGYAYWFDTRKDYLKNLDNYKMLNVFTKEDVFKLWDAMYEFKFEENN